MQGLLANIKRMPVSYDANPNGVAEQLKQHADDELSVWDTTTVRAENIITTPVAEKLAHQVHQCIFTTNSIANEMW